MTDTLIPDREQAASELADLRLRTDLFIDGDFRPARDGRRFVTENPATGQSITEVAEGGPADVDAAVAAARSAFDRGVWSRMDPGARKRVLIAWADLIDANARELGLVETIDAGKPISDTVGLDMPETAACIRWHAEAIDKLYGQVAPSPDGVVATITREPVGVVGAVVPWNYPAQMAAWKLGPALATGNSVVIKPASTTSLSLLRHRRAWCRGGYPGWRPQRRDRAGRFRGLGDRSAPGCRPRRVHRLDGGRPALPSLVGGVEPQARAARARRQEPADRVRRRDRHGERRVECGRGDLLEHGRELQRRVAPDRPPLEEG